MPREVVKDSVFPIHEGSTDRGKWQTRTSIRLCLSGAGMDECVSKTFEYCRVQDFFGKYASSEGFKGNFPRNRPVARSCILQAPPRNPFPNEEESIHTRNT